MLGTQGCLFNFSSSCPLLSSARIRGVHHHAWLCCAGDQTRGFVHAGQGLYQLNHSPNSSPTPPGVIYILNQSSHPSPMNCESLTDSYGLCPGDFPEPLESSHTKDSCAEDIPVMGATKSLFAHLSQCLSLVKISSWQGSITTNIFSFRNYF